MNKYRLISKKGEGTFSEVLKAQSIKTEKHVAIKCMKNHFDSVDQVNNLREIQALRRLAGHPNIIKLHEVLYDEPTGRLALVFELMDMNLYEAIKGRRHYLPESKVKHYMYETLKAINHMHRNGIFHRDVKPENLLLEDDVIKLADLGSCRGIYSRQPFTEYISTRWYRAPECLLTDGFYNFKMDLFAVGSVFFEIVALFPLFPGQNEMDQIQKIHNVLGTPSPELLARKFKRNASHMDFDFPEKKGTGIERLIPHADVELVELMKKLITYDPDDRILARQALKDNYFRDLREAEKDVVAVSSTSHTSVGGIAKSRDPMAKSNMSSSSSGPSNGDHHASPENTVSTVAPEAVEEEPSGGLPSIRQEKRDREKKLNNAVPDVESGDAAETAEGTVLPPIGGLKGKRDSKQKPVTTVKHAGASTLTKQPTAVNGGPVKAHHHFTAMSTGAAASTGMSTGDPMSSTNPHSWGGGAKNTEHMRSASPGSAANSATDKMRSTWAPHGEKTTTQQRRYVSPFGAKIVPGKR